MELNHNTQKLADILARYAELSDLITDPDVIQDYIKLGNVNKERSRLESIFQLSMCLDNLVGELRSLESLVNTESDEEMRELLKSEIAGIESKIKELDQTMVRVLAKSDPTDDLDVTVEMRAAAGGQEAALFVGELYTAYYNLAQIHGWKVDIINSNVSDLKGFNSLVFSVTGDNVNGTLKHESGVHRVQRVPETESIGRVHTSTITVSVLPLVDEEINIDIKDEDLRIDTYRSSGNGGQGAQKNSTAVRIVHKPSGITVVCEDERSQKRNKEKALANLKARLYDIELNSRTSSRSKDRKSQVGSGDRSEKIRTYNYPQDRITDHRLKNSYHGISRLMENGLASIIKDLGDV